METIVDETKPKKQKTDAPFRVILIVCERYKTDDITKYLNEESVFNHFASMAKAAYESTLKSAFSIGSVDRSLIIALIPSEISTRTVAEINHIFEIDEGEGEYVISLIPKSASAAALKYILNPIQKKEQ